MGQKPGGVPDPALAEALALMRQLDEKVEEVREDVKKLATSRESEEEEDPPAPDVVVVAPPAVDPVPVPVPVPVAAPVVVVAPPPPAPPAGDTDDAPVRGFRRGSSIQEDSVFLKNVRQLNAFFDSLHDGVEDESESFVDDLCSLMNLVYAYGDKFVEDEVVSCSVREIVPPGHFLQTLGFRLKDSYGARFFLPTIARSEAKEAVVYRNVNEDPLKQFVERDPEFGSHQREFQLLTDWDLWFDFIGCLRVYILIHIKIRYLPRDDDYILSRVIILPAPDDPFDAEKHVLVKGQKEHVAEVVRMTVLPGIHITYQDPSLQPEIFKARVVFK